RLPVRAGSLGAVYQRANLQNHYRRSSLLSWHTRDPCRFRKIARRSRMDTSATLNETEKRAIEDHVKKIVSKWLKIAGAVNVGTLLALIGYVVFVLPDQAADKLATPYSPGLMKSYTDLQTTIGKAEERTNTLFVEADKLKTAIGAAQNQLEAVK